MGAALPLTPQRVADVTPDDLGAGARGKSAIHGVARAMAKITEQRHGLTEAGRCD
ncbi:MAG: hypothetical protein WBF19_15750 [Candidatus Cybelea sp.]